MVVGGGRRTENVDRRGEMEDSGLSLEDGLELAAQGHRELSYLLNFGPRRPDKRPLQRIHILKTLLSSYCETRSENELIFVIKSESRFPLPIQTFSVW